MVSVPTKLRFMRPRGWYATLRHYHEISGVGELVRRYFALNAFDGALTTLGILAGGYIGGVRDGRTLLLVGITTSLAMMVSGFYGSYLVEKAERGREMRELEESTLSSLRGTDIARASRYAVFVIAAADGGSPAVAALAAFLPFFFTGFIGIDAAYALGALICLAECFLLGVFLGRVSRERLLLSGLKLVLAGVVLLVLSLLLEMGIG
jgi:predicted membrane protein (TIGR00267 family)